MTLISSIALLFAAVSPAEVPKQGLQPIVALALACAACLLAALWLKERRQQAAMAQAHEQSRRALASLQSKHKTAQHPGLEAAKSALKNAEIALAVQKKKNFSQGEQLRAAKAQAEEAAERANEAIADAQRAHRAAEAAMVQPQGHKQAPVRRKAPAPAAAEAQTPMQAPAPSFGAAAVAAVPAAANLNAEQPEPAATAEGPSEPNPLQQAVNQAQEALAHSDSERRKLLADLKEARREMARKNKRIEDLRRVDLMSRGKIEVLEDKTKRLGRELYESISLLAQWRGDVGPVPGPKATQARKAAKPQDFAQQADAEPSKPVQHVAHAKTQAAPSPEHHPGMS